MKKNEIIIKETHRGLRYVDGVLDKVLPAGRYTIPKEVGAFGRRKPLVEIRVVDVRERDLTLKGQEILTSDKVAIRVSIVVQFRVVDPALACHEVESFEDRLYTDVQLAARRVLALMTLEEILTTRTRLAEGILPEVQAAAKRYGVDAQRADVKDLTFPGNLQEVMNRVLAAQRMAQVQLTEARTRAEAARIDAEAKAAAVRLEAEAELEALRVRESAAQAYTSHPALLRLKELETLEALARTANARLYVDFDRRLDRDDD
jgi:regulator of protease activity HflC (stomatin/prohibitin superfamily)